MTPLFAPKPAPRGPSFGPGYGDYIRNRSALGGQHPAWPGASPGHSQSFGWAPQMEPSFHAGPVAPSWPGQDWPAPGWPGAGWPGGGSHGWPQSPLRDPFGPQQQPRWR